MTASYGLIEFYESRKKQAEYCRKHARKDGFIHCNDCKNRGKFYMCTHALQHTDCGITFCIAFEVSDGAFPRRYGGGGG